MSEIFNIETVTQIHGFLGIDKPKNPLISIVSNKNFRGLEIGDVRITTNFYIISLKENLLGSCLYGRSHYDFNDGTLMFMAPGQVMASTSQVEENLDGFTIFFHPDLIRFYDLSTTISKYDFFSYEANEALHLSRDEGELLKNIVANIEREIQPESDRMGSELIVMQLELILKYALRFYERQFIARHEYNSNILIDFERFLSDYFSTDQQLTSGIPTVEMCGKAMNMSGKYLSNLLKIETGKTLIDHIHTFLVERAKNALVNTQLTVSELAFSLGFEYHQHFSTFFKKKTGYSPSEYRKSFPFSVFKKGSKVFIDKD